MKKHCLFYQVLEGGNGKSMGNVEGGGEWEKERRKENN